MIRLIRFATVLAFGLTTALNAQSIAPRLSAIGAEEWISAYFMERPSISTDSKSQPHIVCDNGGNTQFMKFHKVNGQWSGGIFAVGSRGGRYSASRLYVGQIEIDPRDRAWISCKFGTKEFGSMLGQGVWLFRDVATSPNPPEQFFRFVVVYKGMGLVSTDAKYPDQGVVLGTFGNYRILDTRGNTIGSGSINAGQGGEKIRFRIASYAPRFGASGAYPDGIWHTCMNGYSALDAKYQNSVRYLAGKGPVTWANYGPYPVMGDDLSHPGIGIDLSDPRVAYMGGVFNGQVCVNVWNGEKMTAPPNRLHVLGSGATREVRHGPAFTPAPGPNGGSFVFWTAGGRIKMGYISKKGEIASAFSFGNVVASAPLDITAGRSPAAATDRNGNIHLVYYNGGIKYRKILVATLEPLAPKGRITNTRTPKFRWSNTQAARYTLEITRDGEKLPLFSVVGTSWTPDNDLPVGRYSWRVKEGAEGSTKPWSSRLTFTIPPAAPSPLTPNSRLPDVPSQPVFEWQLGHTDPSEGTHYRIKIFKDGSLVGDEDFEDPNKRPASGTFLWPEPLDAGIYSWQCQTIRAHETDTYTVASDWSDPMFFMIGVPTAPVILEPEANACFEPGAGRLTVRWHEAEGADTYKYKLIYNGKLLVKSDPQAETQADIERTFAPGRYLLFVNAQNAHGTGPWSDPQPFEVCRLMRPGENKTLAASPFKMVWTRTPGARRYQLMLAVWNAAEGKYQIIRRASIGQSPLGQDPSWTPPTSLPAGAYRWSITDYDTDDQPLYTSVAFFQVGVPGRPEALAPGFEAETYGHLELPFVWEDLSDAATQFQFQILRDGSVIYNSGWLDAEPLEVKNGNPRYQLIRDFHIEEKQSLVWRVRGRNGTGTGPWRSTPFCLTPFAKPTITAPESGSRTNLGSTIEVRWIVPEQTTAVEVFLQRDENEPELFLLTDPEDLNGVDWTPEEAGTYVAKIRAKADGCSEWSEPWTIVVEEE